MTKLEMIRILQAQVCGCTSAHLTKLEMIRILQAQVCGCTSAHPGLPRQKTNGKQVMHLKSYQWAPHLPGCGKNPLLTFLHATSDALKKHRYLHSRLGSPLKASFRTGVLNLFSPVFPLPAS